MKNEYGEPLDKSGYAPSVFEDIDRDYEGKCRNCGRMDRPLHRHEIFHGPYRTKSKRYGAWVVVCDVCHTEMHKFPLLYQDLRAVARQKVMERYGWSEGEWLEAFGKNV